MDFGLDGYLDKFEKHFGSGWTKALLILIGLAITGACLGVIWTFIVAPILGFFEVPGRLELLARILTVVASICAGSVLALRIYDWRIGRKLGSSFEEQAESIRQVNQATDELMKAIEDLKKRQQFEG
jgi:hypothetical protein